MISFCKQHLIDCVILKTYEITQGEWYAQLSSAKATVQYIEDRGLGVLTYGYYYGDDPITESAAIKYHLREFGSHIMDLEGSFDNNQGKAVGLQGLLANHTGTLSLSTWANPATHGWSENLKILDPIIDIYMPQCYDDSLTKSMYDQWIRTTKPIYPTFSIVNTPSANSKSFPQYSLWEYQDAVKYPNLLDQYVKQQKGIAVSSAPTNDKGCVFNAVQVSQFQPQHSEFECGAFTTAVTNFGSPPNEQNTYPLAELVDWAESQYSITAGSNASWNTSGVSIDGMHQYFADTNNLHWWDMDISVNSAQDHDIASIKAALSNGYPVIATVSENSVFDMDLGRNPYWWGPQGTHILVWVGVASDGNLLAYDPANVIQGDGNLQTPKQVQPWPRRYQVSSIDNQWGSIIKMPWLPSIPSNDPLTWPPYTGPTTIPVPSAPTSDNAWLNTAQGHQAHDFWFSTTKNNFPVTNWVSSSDAGIFPYTQGPSFDTGIARSWQTEYQSDRIWGPPISYEFTTMDWSGGQITAQMFAAGRCEWVNGQPHWHRWDQPG